MPYTIEEFIRESRENILNHLTLEESRKLVERLPPAERLRDLPPEERLRGLPPEERLRGLSPEELRRLKDLLGASDDAPAGTRTGKSGD